MELRPYQARDLQRLRAAFRQHRSVLYQAPTGSGKTVLFTKIAHGASDKGKRVWILVHRAELIYQTSAALDEQRVAHGIIAAGFTPEPLPNVQIASVQSLVKRLAKLHPPDLIVIDECFAAGTLVDGRQIETLRSGDIVTAWCYSEGRFKPRRVIRTFRKAPSGALIRVTINGAVTVATTSHPYLTQRGWVPAGRLMPSDKVLCHVESLLYSMWQSDRSGIKDAGSAPQIQKDRPDFLRPGMHSDLGIRSKLDTDGAHKSKVRLSADEAEQPDAQGRHPGENARDHHPHWAQAKTAGRKREATAGTATANVGKTTAAGIHSGVRDPNIEETRQRLSNLLQGGLGTQSIEASNRIGRWESFSDCAEGTGSQKGGVSCWVRVDSVEVLESGNDGRYGGLLPDGLVYNIEVERDHTYTANGAIVHNCHHSVAGSWRAILEAHPKARVLGVTATHLRLDGQGLRDTFQAMITGPSVAELIAASFLARPVIYAPPTDLDLTGLPSLMGDFARNKLPARVDKPSITGSAVEHYARICPRVPAIAFCTGIEHARHVTEQFQAAGFPWGLLVGKPEMSDAQRREAVRNLAGFIWRGVSTVDLVSEGFDLPAVECAIMLRPTQSLGLHLQQIGRVLRPSPGKERAVILDHVGNVLRHGLPQEDREWSLDGRAVRAGVEDEGPKVRQCPECYRVFEWAMICPYCGFVIERESRKPIAEKEGELQELTPEEMGRRRATAERKAAFKSARTWEELERFALERGYGKGPDGNPDPERIARWIQGQLNLRRGLPFRSGAAREQRRMRG